MDNPFEYFFLNDFFDQQYRSDQRLGVYLGCLLCWLFSFHAWACWDCLVSWLSYVPRKLVVRKVLGASVPSILLLFSKDFIKLVLIASVIAIPVVYFVAKRWLGNYAFRIELSWFIFLLPPLLLL
jgi:putative ABC transport system permease protein